MGKMIGIDLGTTHSALSYFDLAQDQPRGTEQPVLPVPQLTSAGVVEDQRLLPSFLYLPKEDEFPPDALALPWDPAPAWVIGELARRHGSQVPTRLVASAKSWLCHAGIDRTSPLLPWQAPDEVSKVSPLEASAGYLSHLRAAWDHRFANQDEPTTVRLTDQDVILTVPASFDAAARELTLQAAVQAGLDQVTLLEEPQAALYAWLESQGESFRKQLGVGDIILVIDVGGGTTDLSLIAVTEHEGDLQLTRLAVGDHILLGGDNMDLALAHSLQQRLAVDGKKLDAWQFHALTYACRQAKESLFHQPSLDSAPIAVPSRGSALIGGTIKTELRRRDLEEILTEGFSPRVGHQEQPRTARRTGLAQRALP
jgi:molecular chaperone DnaK (HSP70)